MYTIISTATRALTLCVAVSLTFGAVVASAGDLSTELTATGVRRSYVVRFPELDLSKIEGVAALYSRLRSAARIVCEPGGDELFASPLPDRACIARAVDDAVAKINRPLLTHFHQVQTKSVSAGPVQLAKVH
jgi:UrcA family protein